MALIGAAGSRIWLRDIDAQAADPVAGTEDARALFWAPDGLQLAFTTASALKKVRLSDGAVQTLCDSCQPAGGGTWSRTGLILFSTLEGSLFGISATGGEPAAITSLNSSTGQIAHIAPHFLPDGRRFLYVIRNADIGRSGLYVGQVGSAESLFLLQGDVAAVYARPGYLLFLRDGTLMARPFDSTRLEFVGEASPLVAADAARNSLVGQPAFSASDTGVLTYAVVERPLTQFQWVGHDGERFLMLRPIEDTVRSSIGVVLNWPALLQVPPSQ